MCVRVRVRGRVCVCVCVCASFHDVSRFLIPKIFSLSSEIELAALDSHGKLATVQVEKNNSSLAMKSRYQQTPQ